MKPAYRVSASLLLLLAWGCATTEPQPRRARFTFTHEGQHYEIVSTVVPTGEGRNLLLLREDEQIVLRAEDADQNGTIDALLAGDATLEAANEIYAIGIAAAKTSGKYALQSPARIHEFSRAGVQYAVQTCRLGPDKVYNKFVIRNANPGHPDEVVLLDHDADGLLDELETGRWELAEGQRFYERALGDGMRKGRIEQVEHRYLVKVRR